MSNRGESEIYNLKERTKQFALRILKLASSLPKTTEGKVIERQIIRSGTSVGSNYRASCRARSRADFIAKLGIVEEETDETIFWLEIIIERKLLKPKLVEPLLSEANELLAIFVSSIKTAKNKR
jgi:four helix bundle protein